MVKLKQSRNKRSERGAAAPRRERLLQEAMTFQQAGEIRKAIQSYRHYLKNDPENAEVLHTLGGLHFQIEDYEAAARYLEQAHAAAPENLEYLNDLGAFKLTTGDFPSAVELLRKLVKRAPDYAIGYYNLGMALHGAERYAEATGIFKQAIRLRPDYAPALYNLGVTYQELGRLGQAEEAFRNACEVEPYLTQSHIKLGEILTKQNRHEMALQAFERAYRLNKKHPGIAIGLAESLHNLGRTEEGIELLQGALTQHPGDVPIMIALGRLFHNAGRMDDAEAIFGRALTVKENVSTACLGYAGIRKFSMAADRAIIERMESIFSRRDLSDKERIPICFALGKIYDDCGEYDQAFSRYQQGNDLQRKFKHYDRGAHERQIDEIILTFTSEFFGRRRHLGSTEELPIFIVGMPRSGTTLTEQILASHSQVEGGGELAYFPSICAQLPSMLGTQETLQACCAALNEEIASEIIKNYRSLLLRHSETARFVTDKMPANYLHLGLIRLLFPAAPIIDCRRDPLDVCLSIYFQSFAKGHGYAYDLMDIGHRYVQYARLMKHWHRALPGPLMRNDYEDLVADQVAKSRQLVAFCGLEWEDGCLEFHKHARDVKTASNWQVRQPIYSSSRQRWRHYEKQLEPLRAALSDILNGYHTGGSG